MHEFDCRNLLFFIVKLIFACKIVTKISLIHKKFLHKIVHVNHPKIFKHEKFYHKKFLHAITVCTKMMLLKAC